MPKITEIIADVHFSDAVKKALLEIGCSNDPNDGQITIDLCVTPLGEGKPFEIKMARESFQLASQSILNAITSKINADRLELQKKQNEETQAQLDKKKKIEDQEAAIQAAKKLAQS